MKQLIVISALIGSISLAHAEFPIVNHTIDELNFNFPNGSGKVNGVSFDIESVDDKLVFYPRIDGAEEIVWENIPSLITDLDGFTMKSAQVSSLPDEFKVKLGSLIGQGFEGTLNIQDFEFSCLNSRSLDDPYIEMLDSCTSNSKLEWSKFESNLSATKSQGTEALKLAQAASNLFQTNKAFDEINITDVNLRIENNKLGGYFRMPVKGKVRKIDVKGDVVYDEANQMVKISFDWISYFFVNVTDDFFKELEVLESDTFVVENPNIYIKLDQ